MIKKHELLIRQPVPVGITKQQNTLTWFGTRMRHFLNQVHDDFLGPTDGSRRPACLDHQHVAVGQDIEGARIREVLGERLHFQAGRGGGRRPVPVHHLRDVHRRQQILMNRRKVGIGTYLTLRVDGAGPAPHQSNKKRGRRGSEEGQLHVGSFACTPTP